MDTFCPKAVYKIAKIKQKDDHQWHLPLEGIAWSVIGTAKSIGIHVHEASEEQDGDDKDKTVTKGN